MTIKELTIFLVTEYERSGSLNRVCSMMATMLEYAYKFSDDNTVHWQASFSDKYNAANHKIYKSLEKATTNLQNIIIFHPLLRIQMGKEAIQVVNLLDIPYLHAGSRD